MISIKPLLKMDKVAKIIVWWSVATTTLVLGDNNNEPLNNLFRASNTWSPLLKLSHDSSYLVDSSKIDYMEYEQHDYNNEDAQIINKRSHTRQPICDTLDTYVYYNSSDGFEYRPNHYTTSTCVGSTVDNSYQTKNKCTEAGLSCTQMRKKIYITRRKATGNKANNCWEHVALAEVDAGCECKYHIGDKDSYRLGK
ncbi:uncharacterized protein LOC128268103 [Anopheles cruzii]|uniref:uncharacterized protein LOC128268103 n=1 Tax=Anopheles cruzii TaxID=68878 RepID=UPI0022EC1B9D|nr:uncharacterized protein LOC128268103 [Anopheles cruzii]